MQVKACGNPNVEKAPHVAILSCAPFSWLGGGARPAARVALTSLAPIGWGFEENRTILGSNVVLAQRLR
jgi:hypothetical protein